MGESVTKAELLAEIIQDHFRKHPEMNLPFSTAKERLGKIGKDNWKKLRKHPLIKNLCQELGIKEATNDNRSFVTHWKREVA